jgi:Domain of unknown function (DUF3786)
MTSAKPHFTFPSGPNPDSILQKTNELRTLLSERDPADLALRTGSFFQRAEPMSGFFQLEVWSRPIVLSFPTFQACDAKSMQPISPFTQALILYYFTTADGTPLSGKWIAFSELPDGRFYNQAFQGYTGGELTRHFKSNTQAFLVQAEKAGGILLPQAPGDAAFHFQALPRMPLQVVFWQGDEDFPSSYQVLFDASAANYLPTDGCAILGSTLTGMLMGKKHP